MEIEKYQFSKTARKAAVPLSVLIIINIIVPIAKQYGIDIDESTILKIAFAGYAALLAFINWIKNHKKGKVASG